MAPGRFTEQLIGPDWMPSASGKLIDVVDPTTEEIIARTPEGAVQDVDRAATAALPAWSATPAAGRAELLRALGRELTARRDVLAEVMSRDVGVPFRLSRAVQVGFAVRNVEAAADLAESYAFERPSGDALLRREPVGVVGAITPWNFPLHQIVAKVAYAWAAGNTVILKPSEVAPLVAWHFADAVRAVGLPPGVFNLVGGTGPVVGNAIAEHPGVAAVSFTGSGPAGLSVARAAAGTVKRLSLELGGKGAQVMMPGADLAAVVAAAVQGVAVNSGQVCGALTRLLVPEADLADAEALAEKAAGTIRIGAPLDRATQMGPLVSQVQRERVRTHIRRATEQGARLLTGGVDAPDGLTMGYFVRPTVFSRVTTEMDLHHQEVFGPVLAIETYRDEDDAVRIANDTVYGLTAGVTAPDRADALRVARRMQAGQVWINDAGLDPTAPFGGYKRSGLGREYGEPGLEEFLEMKVVR